MVGNHRRELAVNAHATFGDVIGQLADWRAALSDMDTPDSPRFMLDDPAGDDQRRAGGGRPDSGDRTRRPRGERRHRPLGVVRHPAGSDPIGGRASGRRRCGAGAGCATLLPDEAFDQVFVTIDAVLPGRSPA